MKYKPFSKVSDNSSEIEKYFKEELNKKAVQPSSSMIDQINNILNKKSKFPTVKAIVEDMQKRSGYYDYLKGKKAQQQKSPMEAEGNVDRGEPEIFKELPSIQNTIHNIIQDTKGLLPVPAIFERLQKIYSKESKSSKHWGDERLILYVSKANKEERSKIPNNQDESRLGRVDKKVEFDDIQDDPFGFKSNM
jgi:hypothetical protein